MKKWIILLAVVVVVATVYYFSRKQEFTPPWLQPKAATVTRGDIKVPITATGLIQPNQDVEIKPEATGIVLNVNVVEGSFVRKGDPIVVIDPNDERRLRDRTKAEFDRARALLKQSQVAVERATVAIESAKAHLEELAAQTSVTAYELDKIERTVGKDGKSPHYSDQQIHDVRAQYAVAVAQKQSADIAVRGAELAKDDAAAVALSQEATVESVRKQYEDAESRLSKTTVMAPLDGIVTLVYIKPGMLVQSGRDSFAGGTPLMKLADVSRKKVVARLDEADFGRVLDISPVDALPDMPGLRQAAQENAAQIEKRSGTVRITVDAFPDRSFDGLIRRVEPQGKLNAGSSIIQFDVHVEISDPNGHMLPLGAQAQVEFTVESATDVLRVPAEAVKSLQEQKGVYVKVPPAQGEKFGKKFLPCRFGISDGEFTQLIAVVGPGELKEGTEVYTKLPTSAEEAEHE